jgi:hypothetical protein
MMLVAVNSQTWIFGRDCPDLPAVAIDSTGIVFPSKLFSTLISTRSRTQKAFTIHVATAAGLALSASRNTQHMPPFDAIFHLSIVTQVLSTWRKRNAGVIRMLVHAVLDATTEQHVLFTWMSNAEYCNLDLQLGPRHTFDGRSTTSTVQ